MGDSPLAQCITGGKLAQCQKVAPVTDRIEDVLQALLDAFKRSENTSTQTLVMATLAKVGTRAKRNRQFRDRVLNWANRVFMSHPPDSREVQFARLVIQGVHQPVSDTIQSRMRDNFHRGWPSLIGMPYGNGCVDDRGKIVLADKYRSERARREQLLKETVPWDPNFPNRPSLFVVKGIHCLCSNHLLVAMVLGKAVGGFPLASTAEDILQEKGLRFADVRKNPTIFGFPVGRVENLPALLPLYGSLFAVQLYGAEGLPMHAALAMRARDGNYYVYEAPRAGASVQNSGTLRDWFGDQSDTIETANFTLLDSGNVQILSKESPFLRQLRRSVDSARPELEDYKRRAGLR